jgi:hypothetical protein
VARVRLAGRELVEGDVARGAEGDFLLFGNRDISATGQPGASLPTSKPVTDNPTLKPRSLEFRRIIFTGYPIGRVCRTNGKRCKDSILDNLPETEAL